MENQITREFLCVKKNHITRSVIVRRKGIESFRKFNHAIKVYSFYKNGLLFRCKMYARYLTFIGKKYKHCAILPNTEDTQFMSVRLYRPF